MTKKNKLILLSVVGITSAVLIFLICFFMIPRITYSYDASTDSYYVSDVYGNAKSYTIQSSVHGKPVTRIGARAFFQKDKVESIHFMEDSEVTIIDRLAFSGCSSLVSIDLSNMLIIGRNAFDDCTSLEEVTLQVPHILGSVFYGCRSLTTVELLGVVSIGSFSFAETGIERIILPPSVATVYIDAFYNCPNLKEIIVQNSVLKHNSYLQNLGICTFES